MSKVAFPTLGHAAKFADEPALVAALVAEADLTDGARAAVVQRATELVRRIRTESGSCMEPTPIRVSRLANPSRRAKRSSSSRSSRR